MATRVNPCLLLNLTSVAAAMRFQVAIFSNLKVQFTKIWRKKDVKSIAEVKLRSRVVVLYSIIDHPPFWELMLGLPSISFRHSLKFSHKSMAAPFWSYSDLHCFTPPAFPTPISLWIHHWSSNLPSSSSWLFLTPSLCCRIQSSPGQAHLQTITVLH